MIPTRAPRNFANTWRVYLLPDTPKTIFRPSIVLGDSRHAETTQFDMVKAFVFLAGLASTAVPAERQNRHRECRFCRGRDCRPYTRKISRSTTPIIFRRERHSQTFRELTTASRRRATKTRPSISCHLLRSLSSGSVNFLSNRKGSARPRRIAAESIHAISRLEYRV